MHGAIPTLRFSPASLLHPYLEQLTMPTLIEQVGTGVITGDKVCQHTTAVAHARDILWLGSFGATAGS